MRSFFWNSYESELAFIKSSPRVISSSWRKTKVDNNRGLDYNSTIKGLGLNALKTNGRRVCKRQKIPPKKRRPQAAMIVFKNIEYKMYSSFGRFFRYLTHGVETADLSGPLGFDVFERDNTDLLYRIRRLRRQIIVSESTTPSKVQWTIL